MRAIIYIRVSSKQQEDGASLEVQEAQCRAYCQANGYTVVDVLRDTKSGVHLWDRPEMTKLRQAMAQGACDVVVFWDVSRWAREPGHLVILRSEARYYKIKLACVTEELGDSDEDDLVYYAKGYAAKQEWKAIRRRTLEGRKARAKKGYIIASSKPRYGYRWVDVVEDGRTIRKAKYEIDPDTAPIVQRIFNEALSGKTLRGIAAGLTEDRVPTASGKLVPWDFSMVSRILRYPNYTGQARAWIYSEGHHSMSLPRLDGGIPLPEGTIPQLVSPEVFQAVHAILKNNKQASRRNAKNPEAALLRGGFARCGYCGGTLAVRPREGGKWYVYYCGRSNKRSGSCTSFSISTRILDEAVRDKILSLRGREEAILKKLEDLRAQDPVEQNLKTVNRAIAETEAKLTNLLDSMAGITNKVARAALQRQINDLGERLGTLEQQREEVSHRAEDWDRARGAAIMLQESLSKDLEDFDTLSFERKRAFMTAWRVTAVLWRAEHTPRYYIEIDPPVFAATGNTAHRLTLVWTDKESYE